MTIDFDLFIVFLQGFAFRSINAAEICYYRNQSYFVTVRCPDDCCTSPGSSPSTTCCSYSSWTSFLIPIFVITGICFIGICLIYARPLLKSCFCGLRCPFSNRFQVSSSVSTNINENTTNVIYNTDLPTYETIRKKDTNPPPYNFVTTNPSSFEIRPFSPSAPPEYQSRCNSATRN